MNQRWMRSGPTLSRAMRASLAGALLAAAAAAAVGLGAPAARAASPSVLDQAPAGTQMVAVAPDLKALTGKLEDLNQSLGLNQPDMNNLLGKLRAKTGMKKGVKSDGSVMIAVPNLISAVAGHGKPILLFVPVSDYAEFLTNFTPGSSPGNPPVSSPGEHADSNSSDSGGTGSHPAKPQSSTSKNKVTRLTMRGGATGFAIHSGDYAVLSPSRAMLSGYQPGGEAQAWLDRAGQLGAKYLQGADAAVAMDLQSLSPTLRPILRGGIMRAMDQLDRDPGLDPAARHRTRMVIKVYGDVLDAALRDSQGMVVALDLDARDKGGIGLTYALQFKQGSPSAQLFPGGSGDNRALTAKLPDRPYIAAVGLDNSALNMDEIVRRILAELPADSDSPLLKMYRRELRLLKNVHHVAYGWYTPPGSGQNANTDSDADSDSGSGDSGGGSAGSKNLGGGLLNLLAVVDTDDGKAYISKLQQFLKQLDGITQPMAQPGAAGRHAGPGQGSSPSGPAKPPRGGRSEGPGNNHGPAMMTIHTKVQDHALEVAGTPVTRFSWHMDVPTRMRRQAKPMMMLFGGKLGYSGYLARKGDTVWGTTSTNADLLKAGFTTAAKANGLGAGGPLSRVRGRALPPGGFASLYVSPRGVGQAANRFMPMMGHKPLDIPADLPPLAIGLGARSAGLAYRMYLPNRTIKYAVKQWHLKVNASVTPHHGHRNHHGAQPAPF